MKSFRSRLFFITAVLVFLAAGITTFTVTRGAENHIASVGENHIQAVLDIVVDLAVNQNKQYQVHRKALIESRKKMMKNLMELVFVQVAQNHKKYKNGELSYRQAQEEIFRTLRDFRYNTTGYFWAHTYKAVSPEVVFHAAFKNLETSEETYKTMFYFDETNTDALLVKLNQVLDLESNRSAYVTYEGAKPSNDGFIKGISKLSYIKVFEPWNIVFGTGIYLDDIEKELENHRKTFRTVLLDSFKNLKVLQKGFFFVFNSRGKNLFHPYLKADNLKQYTNLYTGLNLFEEFTNASLKNKKVTYINSADQLYDQSKVLKTGYLKYVHSADWYVGGVVYHKDIAEPVMKARLRIILVAFCVLIISLVLIYFVSRSMTRPVKELADFVRNISASGALNQDISFRGKLSGASSEIKTLAVCFQSMIESLREAEKKKRFTEELILQNDKMVSIGGLAAGMAHEINNPLTGIIQTTHVMNNRFFDENLKSNLLAAEKAGIEFKKFKNYMKIRKIDSMLSRIHEASGRISAIVRNMLSFVRQEDNQKKYNDLKEIVEKSLELCKIDYKMKKDYHFGDIRIIKEYGDLPVVYCDFNELEQVFMNLFYNAAFAVNDKKSSNQNYEPFMMIRMKPLPEKNQVFIEIEDNGPGIEDSVKKRIFDPFYTTKPAGEGTGLGLSVSYFIITQSHRGKMKVSSAPGSGTCFTLTLPLHPPPRI